jgi:hypothetical protein
VYFSSPFAWDRDFPFTHMTVGALLIVVPVGDRGAKGLRERSRFSGELLDISLVREHITERE